MTNRRPKAITDALVSEFDDEVLVFDVANDRAVNLNATAAAVWSLCDGQTDLDGLTEKVGQRFEKPASRELIEFAISELDEHGLLSDTPAHRSKPGTLSRRSLMRTAALTTAIAIPAIAAISTPTAAQSASCRANGNAGGFFDCIGTATGPCTVFAPTITLCDNTQCCSGSCGQDPNNSNGNCVASSV